MEEKQKPYVFQVQKGADGYSFEAGADIATVLDQAFTPWEISGEQLWGNGMASQAECRRVALEALAKSELVRVEKRPGMYWTLVFNRFDAVELARSAFERKFYWGQG